MKPGQENDVIVPLIAEETGTCAGYAAVSQNPLDIGCNTGCQPFAPVTLFDPSVNSTHPPVIGRDRVRPVAIAPLKQTEVGAAQTTVLVHVEPITPTHVAGRLLTHLHRPLRTRRVGAPHRRIIAVAGLSSVYGIGHSVEIRWAAGLLTGYRSTADVKKK